jgi:hypothetical protein
MSSTRSAGGICFGGSWPLGTIRLRIDTSGPATTFQTGLKGDPRPRFSSLKASDFIGVFCVDRVAPSIWHRASHFFALLATCRQALEQNFCRCACRLNWIGFPQAVQTRCRPCGGGVGEIFEPCIGFFLLMSPVFRPVFGVGGPPRSAPGGPWRSGSQAACWFKSAACWSSVRDQPISAIQTSSIASAARTNSLSTGSPMATRLRVPRAIRRTQCRGH